MSQLKEEFEKSVREKFGTAITGDPANIRQCLFGANWILEEIGKRLTVGGRYATKQDMDKIKEELQGE